MNTVTTINLAGTAFQIEDPGYTVLKQYLDAAKASLAGNPDADEILADIERAIADKCRRFMSSFKNVITKDEADTIVKEMGPVGGASSASDSESGAEGAARAANAAGPKKLYRIQEGEWIGGVATGFAAYFDVDVVLIRIAIAALTILTSGGFALVYFIAWMVIPPAVTDEQRAAASGAPFNAQEIVDRVKAEYAKLEQRAPEWKRQWNEWTAGLDKQHEAHKAWKRQRKQQWHWEQRRYRQGPSAVGELLQLVIVTFFIWLGYHYVPQIHDFLNAAWGLFTRVVDAITQSIYRYQTR